MDDARPRLLALREEARTAHDEFLAAMDRVDPGLVEAPGLVGTWNAVQLLAHIAYWAENAVGALEAAAAGTVDAYGDEDLDVDALNAEVAAAAVDLAFPAAQRREEAAFAALIAALERTPPAALDERVRYGDPLETVIRDDSIDHYLEHAADIRAWFDDDADPDAEDGGDEEA